MNNGDVLILRGQEVKALLDGREAELMNLVGRAYVAHGNGKSSLPHSTFLRFPDDPGSRVIALPAYLGGEFELAGLKWIASFPANLDKGLDRASGILILSSAETGRPEAILDASIINAKRTAASAVLAAKTLHGARAADSVGLIGCGVINFEIARFILATVAGVRKFILFDLNAHNADQFRKRCNQAFADVEIDVAQDLETVFQNCSLISFATTAGVPYVHDISSCIAGSTILHVSLRDLAPEVILACDNIVDDADHVSRAQTSIHLTEQLVGNRDFIRCPLSDILSGRSAGRKSEDDIAIFSPFGLGILDIAVGKFTAELARQSGAGTIIESFLPEPWARI
ncbi:MAG: 2,3-diaminopropionate biosynthesis protein SbnB [Blastocatellia bacterium]